jgi:predicted MFS family arabinose efflux permease
VLAPALDSVIGVRGIFVVMLVMALVGILLLHFAVPAEPLRSAASAPSRHENLLGVLRQRPLRPLYFGVFVLHFLMTAMFLAVPRCSSVTSALRRNTIGPSTSASSWRRWPAPCR